MTAASVPFTAVPIVSVVIPVYNGAALIGDTLASLSAQTWQAWEAIVVDDASTDSTRDHVTAWPDPRVRLVCLPDNGGPVRARNHGVGLAQGRYIAALDADDICLPTRLAEQVAYLDASPEMVLVGTATETLRDGRVRPSTYPTHTTPALIDWLMCISNPLVWSSIMMRGTAARALDPFSRPERLYAEDFDLYHRLRPLGQLARLDTVLLRYRQHAGGISQRYADQLEARTIQVLEDRHRATLGQDAPRAARLIVRHLMRGNPVPDRATLVALGDILSRLLTTYFDEHALTPEDHDLICAETAQRWNLALRAGLRAGILTLADLRAVRPRTLSSGRSITAERLFSRAIGAVRQTFAAKIIRPSPSRANT